MAQVLTAIQKGKVIWVQWQSSYLCGCQGFRVQPIRLTLQVGSSRIPLALYAFFLPSVRFHRQLCEMVPALQTHETVHNRSLTPTRLPRREVAYGYGFTRQCLGRPPLEPLLPDSWIWGYRSLVVSPGSFQWRQRRLWSGVSLAS